MVSTKVIGSDWLKADDVTDGDTAVILDEAVVGDVGEDKQLQCTLEFKGNRRKFGFNRTNTKIMEDYVGDETQDWIGKKILLYKNPTTFKGKPVTGVRIGVPKESVKANPGQPDAPAIPPEPVNPEDETPAQRCARGEHLPTTLTSGIKVCGNCGDKL